jgi:hypothetical protein
MAMILSLCLLFIVLAGSAFVFIRDYRRRARLTAQQRQQEDDELSLYRSEL